MPKQILNETEIHEANIAMAMLSGARAHSEAQRLAKYFDCHVSRIYEVTKQQRPRRKTRADKGKRRVDLKQHAGMALATSLVVGYNLDPDLALETARANGHATPVSLGTYRRQLREAGLNRSQRRSKRVVHRNNEAEFPGQIFQCDVSAVKERMVDVRNKRIVKVHAGDVNTNHPNKKSTRIPLWKFTVKDDHSRYLFTRFIACEHETGPIMVDFLLEAFRHMGVPLVLYTDNASVFKSKLTQRAAGMLDRAFAESGGFKFEHHAPYNSNAGGKVESSHQWVEKFEKLLAIGDPPVVHGNWQCDDPNDINAFAQEFCRLYNWTPHRTTHIEPAIRFRAGHTVMRVPPDAILNDAFKAREFMVKVNSDVTITVDTINWQLPTSPMISGSLHGSKEIRNPFIDLAQLAKKVSVVWPVEADWFLAVAGDTEFEIAKREAKPDAAYEFKQVAESTSVQNTKHFRAAADALQAAAKSGEQKIVRPGRDVPFEGNNEQRPAMMPRQMVNHSLDEWAKLTPGAVPPSIVQEQQLDYYAAANLLQGEGSLSTPLTPNDQRWLKSVFGMRDQVTTPELRAALDQRKAQPQIVGVQSA
jgi:transposase InsO family protein